MHENGTEQAGAEIDLVVEVADLPPEGLTFAIDADEVQRAAMAARLGVDEISRLSANLTVTRASGDGVYLVEGEVKASLTQTCVVTLDPLAAEIDSPVLVRYAEFDDDGEDEIDWDLLPDDQDPPEPLRAGGTIDLGELIVEQLALEIDPFPRTPGLPYADSSAGGEEAAENPFSALAALRDKLPK
jgi:uncharacterized metal-binding protein YceD (DUF177 family)